MVCDGQGRPLILLLSEGQMSDYKGAALMIDAFPKAKALLGDRGYDADWFRAALIARCYAGFGLLRRQSAVSCNAHWATSIFSRTPLAY
jgi:transposase